MATPFETFVNAELPKRISIAVPPTGDLDPNKYVVTTGVGLGVKLVDAPTGSGSVISSNIEMIQVVDPNSHDFTLQHTPVTNSLNVFFNGLFLFNFNNYFLTFLSLRAFSLDATAALFFLLIFLPHVSLIKAFCFAFNFDSPRLVK